MFVVLAYLTIDKSRRSRVMFNGHNPLQVA